MEITISATGFDLAVQERAYIEYRMFSAIRRFSRDCPRLSIRVQRCTATPQDGAYRCSTVLDAMSPVRIRVRATGNPLYAAIDSAADRLALAAERRLTAGSQDRAVSSKGR